MADSSSTPRPTFESSTCETSLLGDSQLLGNPRLLEYAAVCDVPLGSPNWPERNSILDWSSGQEAAWKVVYRMEFPVNSCSRENGYTRRTSSWKLSAQLDVSLMERDGTQTCGGLPHHHLTVALRDR